MEIWGDESGNLDFETTGSRYFVVCTIVNSDASLTSDLLGLRRSLTEQGHELHDGFHAAEDRQVVRDAVFTTLRGKAIRVDATYYEKAKAYSRVRKDTDYFYKLAWYMHMRHVLPIVCRGKSDAFIAVATLGVRKKRELNARAIRDVARQCLPSTRTRCAYWSAASHPAIQAADYYTWAIARMLERGDTRSFDLIKPQIASRWQYF